MKDKDHITIRVMRARDWPTVAAIYQEGIATGHATFAERPPTSWDEWCVSKLNACSLVACIADEIVGWAALSRVSTSEVYAGVAEVSVYVSAKARGYGVGTHLLSNLITQSEAQDIWTLQAGIFPENEASLRLHRQLGFREVGRRDRLGKMTHGPLQGQWRNVILLERRSNVAGIS